MRHLCLSIGLILGLSLGPGLAFSQEEAKPNIVILFADDLGYGDLGAFGHPYIRTPNLDQMAAEGQRWTDFYVAAPVCSPSRAALLTGRLPVRTGQYGDRLGVYFPNEKAGFPEAETTLAEMLKAQGYRTGIFGKWHLGDAHHAWPTRHGFDEWLGIPYSNDMDWEGEPTVDEMIALSAAGKTEALAASRVRRVARYADPKQGMWNVPLLKSQLKSSINGQTFVDEVVRKPAFQASTTQDYTQAALDFVKAADGAPFLLYLPYSMPHTPLFRSESFVGKSLGGRYGDVIEEIDWSVGQILKHLRDNDLAENTLVVFSSDNGPWLSMGVEGGRPGLLNNGKGTTYEGGMRVPTIFWWPETLLTGVSSEMGSTLDLYRTVASLATGDGQRGVDGFDLTATLTEGAPSPRTQMPFYRGSQLYAYRSGPWKLHFVTEGRYGLPPVRTEHETPVLFHLGRDPSERFDVAAQNPEVVTRIVSEVALHRAQLNVKKPAMDGRLGG